MSAAAIFHLLIQLPLPGMIRESIFLIGLEELDQLISFLERKAPANSDMLQSAGVVIKTQQ